MIRSNLGFDERFRKLAEERRRSGCEPARVSAVDRERCLVAGARSTVPAELTGSLLYGARSRADLPCVGDWVLVSYCDEGSHAIIHDILPRRSVLRRKSAGREEDCQPIAANVDVAFIVQACDSDFNLNRLDRYVVMARDGGIEPVVLLSKCDLVDADDLRSKIAEVNRSHPLLRIFPLSCLEARGLGELRSALENEKTYCLVGSSGVGKSTLLNTLVEREVLPTGAVRMSDGRGRHTTARRELILLDNGAILIDTPGMRELGMVGVESGIDDAFSDITELAAGCRFSDCSHRGETGCEVIAAVRDGRLSERRYQSFLKLAKESAFYEMSQLERRAKERAFGKFVKDAVKHDRKR